MRIDRLTPTARLARSTLVVALILALICSLGLLMRGEPAGAKGSCAAVKVLAVRGSGDPDQAGPGRTLRPFVNQLKALADPGAVEMEGLRYDAVPIDSWRVVRYRHSVDQGVSRLVRLAKDRAKECGGTSLVLAGYSQGAQVVHEALPRLTGTASHIGAVVLFGDPHFDPHSRAALGTFSEKRHGILGLPEHDFPAAFPHVASFCRGGDWVCEGLPNTSYAHNHYAPRMTQKAALKVADWLGLRRSRRCAPATNVAAILDDSGSMSWNDPLNIRAAAMQLLITQPGGRDRTLGAVEFGTEAGTLFPPATVAAGGAEMLAALGGLDNAGFQGTGDQTDYNAAFAAAALQPAADARIFLTDGEHNVGDYENGHSGGPRTYVIGLNIGRAGEGSEAADLLGRIAAETGGVYYPLRRDDDDSAAVQVRRLQPVFNSINAELECQIAPSQAVRSLRQVGAPAKPVNGSFLGNVGEQIVVSWTTPGAVVEVTGISIRNPGGGLVANSTGRSPKGAHRKGKKVEVVQATTVSGDTFRTVTVARPKHGAKISVRITAKELPAPTVVTVQMSPVDSLPAAPAPTVTVPALPSPGAQPPPPSPPPPPTTYWEQETPNHPVNTFTNYHNASGMGPPIAAGQWVEVSCRVYDPTIASVNPDGYWYRIASSPWNNAYYAPANTFMNGDPYGGPYTHNTDFAVPVC
ncbi:MAG TPA: cutinase family protein [Solirubrobacterales bacterium]|nr:cutinase family protein [Solirubrobacterales bacterium]